MKSLKNLKLALDSYRKISHIPAGIFLILVGIGFFIYGAIGILRGFFVLLPIGGAVFLILGILNLIQRNKN